MDVQAALTDVRQRFAGGRERLFVLHGNVSDVFPVLGADGTTELCSLAEYIQRTLSSNTPGGRQRIFAQFSPAFGLRWPTGAETQAETRIEALLAAKGGGNPDLYRTPIEFFRMLDHVCTRREKPSAGTKGPDLLVPIRAIVTEAAFVVPNVPQTAFLRPEQVEIVTMLRRFAIEREYDPTDTMIVLITEAVSDIHPAIREVAVTLEVSRPNEREVADYVDNAVARSKVMVADGAQAQIRKLAVGLTRRQVENAVAEHVASKTALGAPEFAARRRELTARDFGDLLEFSDPDWTLTDVGGAVEAVAEFQQLDAAIKRGDPDIPAGIIVGGQNGVGKTHLLKAFAGTVGITVVTLKSFKTADYGGSERAWDKIATALTSAGQIIVIVEEADGVLGQRTGPNVHEVSKAILSRQLALMGDPKYRGRILWLLDTCRPDKLAPDVKRPGRCERVIPLFPETSADGIRAVIRAQVGLLGRQLGYQFADGFADAVPVELLSGLIGKSGAQVKRVLERTRRKYAPAAAMTVDHLARFVTEDASLKVEPEAYELQRLIAIAEAVETENTDLVPKFYLDQVEAKYGGIGGMKERIDVLRRRIDGD